MLSLAPSFSARYAAARAGAAWQRSLDELDTLLSAPRVEQHGCGQDGRCGARAQHGGCGLVVMRHIAKTGGVSVREWMLRLERQGRAQYLGPVTWMKDRGRYCSHGRYLHCCHPLDARPAAECRKVTLTEARAEAIRLLAIGGGALSNCSARRAKAAAAKAGGTELATAAAPAATVWCRDVRTMLEFHWPDSGLGRWGEPHTFLQMLPAMRPQRLPAGCRVVVTTLLRQPARLYPSLQLHQFPSMRGYNDAASNLSACDYAGFVAAFPNFQGWRLTSAEWSPLPLSAVPHAAMLAVTTRLLSRFDLVGVTGRMADWLMLLCARAGIVPCPA
eukprot:6638858-Prymnesium_polylepis.1